MRRRWVAVAFGAMAVGAPGHATGQGTAGEGAIFLVLPVGAHGVSLGRAMTAMSGQESVFWNPAGLAGLDRSRIVLVRGQSVIGTHTGVSTLFVRPGVGTLGASYLLWDAGEEEQRDAEGNFRGTEFLRNHIAVVSGAARFLDRVDAGVNLKLVRFRRSCRGACFNPATSAGTVAVDAGVQVTPTPGGPLRIGAMIAHLGSRFQHENAEQADPLPTRVRLALAYDVLGAWTRRPGLEGWLTVELQDRVLERAPLALFVGSEVVAGTHDRLYLRAGYVATDPDQAGGAAVGFGLRLDSFELSVTKSLVEAGLTGATEPFTAALSFAF